MEEIETTEFNTVAVFQTMLDERHETGGRVWAGRFDPNVTDERPGVCPIRHLPSRKGMDFPWVEPTFNDYALKEMFKGQTLKICYRDYPRNKGVPIVFIEEEKSRPQFEEDLEITGKLACNIFNCQMFHPDWDLVIDFDKKMVASISLVTIEEIVNYYSHLRT